MPVPILTEVVAHCADLAALHVDADRRPPSGADGDRDALRILLSARQDLTITIIEQSNRLRALLLGGDDTDRRIARGPLNEATLASLIRRREPRDVTRQHAVRHAEIRRLALLLSALGPDLKANTRQLQSIVDDLVPGLTDRRGIGPVRAAQAIVSLSHPSTVPRQRGAGARRNHFAASQHARSRVQLEALPVERPKGVEVAMIQSQDPMGAVAAGQHDQ
ncbi:MAG: hypothetical protein ACRDTX_12995 [Pseudonocardiaceae bacterium]